MHEFTLGAEISDKLPSFSFWLRAPPFFVFSRQSVTLAVFTPYEAFFTGGKGYCPEKDFFFCPMLFCVRFPPHEQLRDVFAPHCLFFFPFVALGDSYTSSMRFFLLILSKACDDHPPSFFSLFHFCVLLCSGRPWLAGNALQKVPPLLNTDFRASFCSPIAFSVFFLVSPGPSTRPFSGLPRSVLFPFRRA